MAARARHDPHVEGRGGEATHAYPLAHLVQAPAGWLLVSSVSTCYKSKKSYFVFAVLRTNFYVDDFIYCVLGLVYSI